MVISLFVVPLSALLIFLKGVDVLYFFQIKEYRFDRVNSALNEIGIFQQLYSVKINVPAKSPRNSIIMLCFSCLLLIAFLASFDIPFVYGLFFYGIVIAPFFAFLLISFFVYITSLPVKLFRESIIMQAQKKVKKTHAQFVGITGSYGKTSVKEYLAAVLEENYTVAKTPLNMNTDVGIAQSINRNLADNTDLFIVEAGAYKRGEIRKATAYIPFSFAVLTGLGNQHLDLYKSREALIEEESSLLFRVKKNGAVYINETVPNLQQLKRNLHTHVVVFGISDRADARYKLLQSDQQGTKIHITYKELDLTCKIQLLGEHNALNLLPAISLAYDLGMKAYEIKKKIEAIEPLPGKLSLHGGPRGAIVVHDAINSNVEGFKAMIDVLSSFKHMTRKILATQGIIELGVEKCSSYEAILNKLANTGITMYTTDSLFKKLCNPKKIHVEHFTSPKTMMSVIKEHADKQTVIGLEGKFSQSIISTVLLQPLHD
ncbi:UDP-N-acetylmuramoyl-tripeptide--D-alanyl-D-alanine ligase [Candidatus Woesebacteria bacterium]|nr:UDP-N-acetylmuramoyl-tripeptide--D-alanyl-D-alanine ligase [Candidatus Woesebacteria bacterium]